MYRIKRIYRTAKKQTWLVKLLVKIKPAYFAPKESREESRKALKLIGEFIRREKLNWRRGNFNLSHIRDIRESDDEITISYKDGKPYMSFRIEENKTENL